jgi:outer membrane protein OmpA-like peptidoglycan-associated protein
MSRPRAAVLTVVAGVLALTATVANAQTGDPQAGQVIDGLDGVPAPSAADISDSIRRLEIQVIPWEIPEPRALRDEREEDDQTVVTLGADVLFAFDSAEVTGAARGVLESLATELAETSGTIEVVGHTDSVGTDAYNQQLSEQRAEAVAQVLQEALGQDREITTEGRSFRDPVVEENDEDPAAAAQNRRVEIRYQR